jgi:hypothetical protein
LGAFEKSTFLKTMNHNGLMMRPLVLRRKLEAEKRRLEMDREREQLEAERKSFEDYKKKFQLELMIERFVKTNYTLLYDRIADLNDF